MKFSKARLKLYEKKRRNILTIHMNFLNMEKKYNKNGIKYNEKNIKLSFSFSNQHHTGAIF